jgi:transcriptional regulator with XRE-family HTH domain
MALIAADQAQPRLRQPRPPSGSRRSRQQERYESIGARLRFLRTAAGYSQSQIADHLGLSFQQVQKYESGANRIPAADMQDLAELFGCSFADLLGATEGDGIALKQLDRRFLDLAQEWAGLSEDVRSAMLKLARAMNAARQGGA